MKRIYALATVIGIMVSAVTFPSLAQRVSCRDALKACQRWCYAERSGPERFQCKGNCRSEFNSALSSGVFRREDGAEIECQAMPHVAWQATMPNDPDKRRLSASLY